MQELNFHLSVGEANQILDALGQQPYIQVHELIMKLQQQAAGQLQPSQDNVIEQAARQTSD